ncbi:DUF411 domain-containing protein [Maliponia aquimaris]|uniref:Metal-binding protein n=1 Tax=Maliponia aquimaris TaxID=1673631 RepID=A0A238K5X6_9RHOB|nr:DUF411 domain-containing protein [Maliponia aquimaris]SMX38225.1 hypothetical protein MAA8898_01437 [Maliponia aquimaris]
MPTPRLDRRQILLMAAAATALPGSLHAAGGPAIHVVKDPNCGCCGAWIEILQAEGFEVSIEHARPDELAGYKMAKGIPPEMASCHTAQIQDYMIEGHVPVADIRRLLDERPEAVGLSVPGMPFGSPGMGPESQREAYDVHLIRRDGSTQVFSSYPAAA